MFFFFHNSRVDDVSLMEQSTNSRPSRAMLLKFGERGMGIQELVCLLTALRLEKALNYFYKFVNGEFSVVSVMLFTNLPISAKFSIVLDFEIIVYS